jgi:acyl transferase domain-containing protein/acyl carrier protein
MTASKSGASDRAVAIVGVGCRFPGGVADAEEFWKLLEASVDAIGEIPSDRFEIERLFDPAPATPGRTMTRWGGFLDGIREFDADFFRVSPREAEYMDPQQRLLLETAWEAFEDAGQDLRRVEASRVGVFIGQWISDFESRLFADPEAIDFYMTTGSGRYAASGRLSYLLGFRGPSMTLDTACSSSLVAIHLAVRSIRSGESRIALAGGANVILQPHISIAYSQSRMLASNGRCKFGDAAGDGYVRSEGVGLVVLKSIEEAIADGDRIYALIRGSAVNNDGAGSGSMGTPSRAGQQELLRAAYADAGVPVQRVGYVEAHGTGTRVGDPVELGALSAVLGERGDTERRVYVGSVKTNIGHTEGAAGVAGLIKAALAVQRGIIPASLNCENLNPAISWPEVPCEIPRARQPWLDDGLPRVAGVSAFGIAGTNAHVVLEQACEAEREEVTAPARQLGILPLSANSTGALRALAERYADLLSGDAAPTLHDVCWNAAVRRTALDMRAVFLGADRLAMVHALRGYASGDAAAAEGSVQSPQAAIAMTADVIPPKVVFVIPGQGAQWVGMGRELLRQEPVFRAALERCDQAARAFIGWSIVEQLGLDREAEAFRLDRIEVIQPVLVALGIAYAELLISLGIKPDAVVGHSMGEVAAAHIAGCLSLEQAMRVVCRRSALMSRVSGQGAMALVDLSIEALQERLSGLGDQVSVAASNGPRSSVMSGSPEAVQQVMAGLQRDDVFCRLVNVDVASHSPQMEPLAAELAGELSGLQPGPVRVPLYSTVFGRRVADGETDAAYWGRNMRQPVLFAPAVSRLVEDDITVFVELGPHPVLLPSIQQTAPSSASVIACGRRDECEQSGILTVVGALWSNGYPIDWDRVMPERGRAVWLPHYPWQREPYWCEAAEIRPSGGALRRKTDGPDKATIDWLHRLEWKPADAKEAGPRQRVAGWIVVSADAALGEAVVAAFRGMGQEAELVDGRTLEAALRSQAARSGAPCGVVVLAENEAEAAFTPVRVLQACLAGEWAVPPRLWFVTRGAQVVATGAARPVSVVQAALWGAARVVGEEHPELWGGLVDLDPDGSDSANAGQLVGYLARESREDHVALRGERWYAPRLVQAGGDMVLKPFAWREDCAYLITGGLGDIGLLVAGAMAAAGARRLILLGRTALPPRAQWTGVSSDTESGRRIAAVCALEARGVAVHVAAVDVGDAAALEGFLARYEAEGWPPIKGVVHSAVIVNNHLSSSMERSAFEAVLGPKLRAAELLDRLLPELDLFVLFSSIGALLPQVGMANYAAANVGLDAIAHNRRARGQHAVSVAWGPWENAGLVSSAAGARAAVEMQRQGIGPCKAGEATALFMALCGCAESNVAAVAIERERLRAARSVHAQPLFDDVLAGSAHAGAAAAPVFEQLADASPARRQQIFADLVKQTVGQVLKIGVSRIDARKTLGNMGLNSLMAIELRNRLETLVGRPLSATLAWNYPTVDALAAYFAGEAPSRPRDDAQVVAPATVHELSGAIAQVAALSDEAAMMALLAQPRDAAE